MSGNFNRDIGQITLGRDTDQVTETKVRKAKAGTQV
jgi:hypothetical protein